MIDVLDCIDELVDHTTHREPFTHMRGTTIVNDYWTTTHPSLLDQLAEAIEPTNSTDTGRGTPTSKPTARIEAIDALARIDREGSRWLRNFGYDDPGTTADCVRMLAPTAAAERPCRLRGKDRYPGCCLSHDLTGDIRAWWTWARVLTGWDSPAWRPDNTCPLCGERGTLRVRIVEKIGLCVADKCHETWEPETISFLADHIRAENRDTAEVAC